MKFRDFRRVLFAVAFTLLFACGSEAQRLYNKDRDDQAQAAKKLIDSLQNGTVFDKQLKNLATLSKQDIETTLVGAQSQMRTNIGRFSTWKDVNEFVQELKEKNLIADNEPTEAQRQATIKALRAKIATAKQALKSLQDEAACRKDRTKCDDASESSLSTFFERVSDLREYEDYLNKLTTKAKFSQSDVQAIGKVLDTLDILKGAFERYENRLAEYNGLKGTLIELRVPLKKVALQALNVEVQHWENVGRIRARREEEEGEIKSLIKRYEDSRDNLKLSASNENIEMSLRGQVNQARRAAEALDAAERPDGNSTSSARVITTRPPADLRMRHAPVRSRTVASGIKIAELQQNFIDKRARVADTVFALHLVAALAARGTLPVELARLRLAQEEHAFSIRQSAVLARAYELTVSTGVQRLALYHQGGIKPSQIAQLIYSAATVAIPPIIAVK